uniref:Putative secreted protein n=1 Tax=Rhipicephalus microplus TaxID=6941 RepID=A0A6M2DCG1_RHIMP
MLILVPLTSLLLLLVWLWFSVPQGKGTPVRVKLAPSTNLECILHVQLVAKCPLQRLRLSLITSVHCNWWRLLSSSHVSTTGAIPHSSHVTLCALRTPRTICYYRVIYENSAVHGCGSIVGHLVAM